MNGESTVVLDAAKADGNQNLRECLQDEDFVAVLARARQRKDTTYPELVGNSLQHGNKAALKSSKEGKARMGY